MDFIEENENEKIIDELTKSIVKQLSHMKKDDNSSIHLEGTTLQLLILSLFHTKIDHKERINQAEMEDTVIPDEMIEQFNNMMNKNKVLYEEIINILKANIN